MSRRFDGAVQYLLSPTADIKPGWPRAWSDERPLAFWNRLVDQPELNKPTKSWIPKTGIQSAKPVGHPTKKALGCNGTSRSPTYG